MNYELAKQLKDAGYPQEFNPKYDTGGGGAGGSDIRLPNLEELIDACGEEFLMLRRIKDNMWEAHSLPNESKSTMFGEATKEEAVAKLWLELNKK